MSNSIRCIYHGAAPHFPASDQHPDAVRWFVVDNKVISEVDWQRQIDQSVASAKLAIFGTVDDAAIAAEIEGLDEDRGVLKQSLTDAIEARLPAPDLVVDAIGEPSIEEIDAVLNPPPAPEPTVTEKLAAAGLTIGELKDALGLPRT